MMIHVKIGAVTTQCNTKVVGFHLMVRQINFTLRKGTDANKQKQGNDYLSPQ